MSANIDYLFQPVHPCPTCGACPTCGRGPALSFPSLRLDPPLTTPVDPWTWRPSTSGVYPVSPTYVPTTGIAPVSVN